MRVDAEELEWVDDDVEDRNMRERHGQHRGHDDVQEVRDRARGPRAGRGIWKASSA